VIESNQDDREIFADGNMSEVIRQGTSVFRDRAPWSDAAHQVLRHLESRGFPLSPRVLEVTESREELSFIPGRSMPADLCGYEDEAMLVQLGTAIRSLHDAMQEFQFTPGTSWVPMVHAPQSTTLVCHSDIEPWNTIVAGGQITGLID
jgi:aminoglycoside phosphotransferase